MTTVQHAHIKLAVLQLLGATSSSQHQEAKDKEKFRSLLDIGAGTSGEGELAEDAYLAQKNRRLDDTLDPIAVPIEVPRELFTKREPENKDLQRAADEPEIRPAAPARKNEPNEAPSPAKPLSERREAPAANDNDLVTDNATPPVPTQPSVADSAQEAVAPYALPQPLREQLQKISQFVFDILRALSAGGPSQQGEKAIDGLAGEPYSLDSVLKQIGALASTAQADSTSGAVSLQALLQRLQTLLQNLQQALQANPQTMNQQNVRPLFGQLVAATQQLHTLLADYAGADNAQGVDPVALKEALKDNITMLKSIARQVKIMTGDDNGKALSASLAMDKAHPLLKVQERLTQAVLEGALQDQQRVDVTISPSPFLANAKQAAASATTTGAVVSTLASSSQQSGQQGHGSEQPEGQVSTAIPASLSSAKPIASNNAASFAHMLQRTAPKPVLEQVVFHIKTVARTGNSTIHIQLDPAELGKLEIKIELLGDGKTGVSVLADNKDTLDTLQRDARGLERALAEAGLKAESGSLSFNLRGGDQQETGQDHSHASNHYQKALPEEEDLLPEAAILRSYVVDIAEGLDIKI